MVQHDLHQRQVDAYRCIRQRFPFQLLPVLPDVPRVYLLQKQRFAEEGEEMFQSRLVRLVRLDLLVVFHTFQKLAGEPGERNPFLFLCLKDVTD